jgi:choline dehydrogenase-like flavoprotein
MSNTTSTTVTTGCCNTTTTTTTNNPKNIYDTYDYVIVGGGTSAMGLLFGLLSSTFASLSESTQPNHHQQQPHSTFDCKIRIAVIERGTFGRPSIDENTVTTTFASTSTKSTSTASSLRKTTSNKENHEQTTTRNAVVNKCNEMSNDCSNSTNTLVRSLHRWCAASHPTYLNQGQHASMMTASPVVAVVHEGKQVFCRGTSSSSNSVSSSCSDHCSKCSNSIWHRTIQVPTGSGMGGTTLINAGLVLPPCYEMDFVDWPDTIQSNIAHSIHTIVSTMHHNQCIHPTSILHSVKAVSNTSTTTATTAPSPFLSSTSNIPIVAPIITVKQPPFQIMPTTFPSCCIDAPCSVRRRNENNSNNNNNDTVDPRSTTTSNNNEPYHRVSYYESLVEPLLRQQQRSDSNNTSTEQVTISNRFEISFLTGYNVERLILDPVTTKKTTTSTNPTAPICIGVEMMHGITGTTHIVSAIHDIIVCTGTIVSPVLLLLAGIGNPHHDHHCRRSTSPKNPTDSSSLNDRVPPSSSSSSSIDKISLFPPPLSQETSKAAVGCKMQDHMILTRILFTRPYRHQNTLNGVRAITNLHITTATTDNTCTRSATTSTQPCDTKRELITKAQINLMDSAAYYDLLPLMGAALFRYQIDIHNWNEWIQSNNHQNYMLLLFWFLPQDTLPRLINTLLQVQYHIVYVLLHVLLHYTPLYYVAKCCIKIIAIFIMNGQSHGTVTILPRKQQSDGTVLCRVSDVSMQVQLGYLSHPNDVQRFQHAFAASTNVYDSTNTLQTICEILPGPLIWNYDIKQTTNRKPPTFNTKRFEFMARSMVQPYFHWIGTCAMKKKTTQTKDPAMCGSTVDTTKVASSKDDDNHNHQSSTNDQGNDDGDDWVVDELFRVRGVQHLRICDASIFPTLISAPTALTCAGIGHILANILLEEISKREGEVKKRL